MNLLAGARFFGRLLLARMTGRQRPLTAIVNLTNRCNLRCRHCYADYYERDASSDLSTVDAKRLFTDLRDNGLLRLSLSGGEVLLRDDLTELIAHAKSLGLNVTVNSNGLLIPTRLDALHQADTVAVSLDGTPEHHDLIRGPGTALKAIAGIRAARAAGLPTNINLVINRHNLHDVDYILDLCRETGANAEFALMVSRLAGTPDDLKPTTEEFRQTLRLIIDRKHAGAPIVFSAQAYESILACWPDFSVDWHYGPPPPLMPLCPAGRFFCLVDTDGRIWTCPHLIDKVPAENALQVGVRRALDVACANRQCTGCYQACFHEFSHLMSLSPLVIWNYVRYILRRK